MFYYDKIDITDITKSEPIGTIRDVFVIGSSLINDHVEEFYFKLEQREMKTTHHNYYTTGYMRAKIPLRFLNDMYLYVGISGSEQRAMFFIEPKLYERLGEDEISLLILSSSSLRITGETNHNLPDPLKEFYLPASIYYELTCSSKEEYGHQYLTEPLLPSIVENKKDFHEHYEYLIHREPLCFYINRKQLLFISTEDLETQTMRLLQTNNEGVLFERDRFHKDDFEEVMWEDQNNVMDLIRVNQIKEEVESFMSFDFT